MRTLNIQGQSGTSKIMIGERLQNLVHHADTNRLVIISDAAVLNNYRLFLPDVPLICIGQGEQNKNLDTVHYIYQKLLDLEVDRGTCIVGVGGGIVCDVAGFAAATYLRGLSLGLVASTLLAQVDASAGGKNGVNFLGYKNLVGTFKQPQFVICDLEMLNTLPFEEAGCGFAEIVKHAAIADVDMFQFLEERTRDVLKMDKDCLQRLVYDSVRIKAEIVNRDELESGERRKLNFGHTFGHALEKVFNIPHGHAVSQGMVLAAQLSVKRGLLSRQQARRLTNVLQGLGLPTRIQGQDAHLIEALGKDKKREGQDIHFVLLKEIGHAVLQSIKLEEVRQALVDLNS